MKKVQINRACGHIEMKEVYGALKNRAEKIAKAEAFPCITCQREKRALDSQTEAGLTPANW